MTMTCISGRMTFRRRFRVIPGLSQRSGWGNMRSCGRRLFSNCTQRSLTLNGARSMRCLQGGWPSRCIL